MSLSLLNDYDSSESEEDPPLETAGTSGSSTKPKGKNFFICSSESDASESENSDNERGNEMEFERDSTKPALPRPFDNFLAAGSDTSSVSVFRNPFLEAEKAETILLEQHVKLSETAYRDGLNDEERAKRRFRKSSLPCRQFKRGRCRMGDKCRFVHAVPNATPGEIPTPASSMAEEPPPPPNVYGSKAVRYTEWGKEEIVGGDDEDGEARKKRKRRVGVTNSLIPPKRALASFEKQRREETPWMDD